MPSESTPQQATVPSRLYDDPETGEKISKSELKRRTKQRQQEKRAQEKKTISAQDPVRTASSQADVNRVSEDDLNPNQYFEIRSKQINELRSTHLPNPYPHKFHVSIRVAEFIKKYNHLGTGETLNDEIRMGVRIMKIRSAGSSLRFYDCKGEGVAIQIFCDLKHFQDAQNGAAGASFAEHHSIFRRGDWIGVVGFPGRTNPKSRAVGELSVFARDVILLSPCLRQLPSPHHGFTNQEQRYRQRYLDLMINDSTRETFQTRSKIVKCIRRFLDDRDFLEVQTPMMNQIAGGAIAKPFKTFHNDLNLEMFMRVAPELYLKLLVIGGLERVYEIGRQFRNEDIDLTHNPEFTTCEFYSAFSDMYDLIDMTEELISGLVKEVTGSDQTVLEAMGKTYNLNWTRPFKRVKMIPSLEEATGEKFPPADQLHTDESAKFLERVLDKMGITCTEPRTNARMLDKLVGDLIEPHCENPTFIIGHPQVMSPLAKPDRETPGLCERFEMFAATKELINAYTELNDPVIQRHLFLEQAKDKAKGDDEALPIDEKYCLGLEYGLPPTAGWGLGIDRLTMFLTNKYNIKEVLAFPMLRDEHTNPQPQQSS